MRKRMSIALVVAGGGLLVASWLFPIGHGEYRDSPDGLWRAHVSGLSRGTLLGSRRRYVELTIERLADSSSMWRREVGYTTADSVPAYGDRSKRFIIWATDSTQFSVITTNGATMTVPITVATGAQPGGH